MLSSPLLLLQSLVAVPLLALSGLWDQVHWQMDVQGILGWKVWAGVLFDGGGLLLAGLLATLAIAVAKPLASFRANTDTR